MYDLNDHTAGREHHQELLNEAAQERLARQTDNEENLVSKLGAMVTNAVDALTNAQNTDRATQNENANKAS